MFMVNERFGKFNIIENADKAQENLLTDHTYKLETT